MLAEFLEREEGVIRKNVLKMGQESAIAVERAVQCYKTMDTQLAQEIIDNDKKINELQEIVESECIQLIALQQPVAHDLRELLADMNIAKELERIADYATSIAKIVQKLPNKEDGLEPEIIDMAEKSMQMLNEVMLDYAEKDAKKANNVALKDDELDEQEDFLNHKMFKIMQEDPDKAVSCTYQLWIIHQFERIGDRVTNIAESVVFLATGKVVNFN